MKLYRVLPLALTTFPVLGCYDFDKVYDPCRDNPPPAGVDCTSVGAGGATGGGASSGGFTGSGASSSGGAMGTGSGPATGGTDGAGGTAGSGGIGGSGGTGGTANLSRLRLVEACPVPDAVELQNQGPGAVTLDGLAFNVSSTGYQYSPECLLGTGTLAGGEFMVVAKTVGACAGITVRCVDGCPLDFNASTANAWINDGGTLTSIAGFDGSLGVSPGIGQCWYVPSGGGIATAGAASLGVANP